MTDLVNKEGDTALHIAASQASITAVGALLEQGAQVDLTDRAGMTPLHRLIADNASKGSNPHVIEQCVVTLLGAGASLTKCDKVGKTPCGMAHEFGLKSVVRVMHAAAKIQKIKATMPIVATGIGT